MTQDVLAYMQELGQSARAASRVLASAPTAQKNQALLATAQALEAASGQLLAANAKDMQAGRDSGLDDAMLDRLELTPARIQEMIEACAKWLRCLIPLVKSRTCAMCRPAFSWAKCGCRWE